MEDQSAGSRIQMAKSIKTAGIDDLTEDLMRDIFVRLPAKTFARAACVNCEWRCICKRFLTTPKLSTALSLNTSLEIAVNEVVEKVLSGSGPVIPNFALASVGLDFSLPSAHQMISDKLGSGIPLITNVAEGIIGKDMHTSKFVEVHWKILGDEDCNEETENKGIILTVGFLPGLKAHIVPLFMRDLVKGYTMGQGPEALFMDDMVVDIRSYVSTVSDSEYPLGIMFFADRRMEMKPLLRKIEFSFSPHMALIGGTYRDFMYTSSVNATITRPCCITAAAALVFARDKNKPIDIGETNFQVMLSPGLSPVGSTFKASYVDSPRISSNYVTASIETYQDYLNGLPVFKEICDQLKVRDLNRTYCIGVTKSRNCSVGKEKARQMQFLEFHNIAAGAGPDDENFRVDSYDIEIGDPFRFYFSNSEQMISSCKSVSDKLKNMKQDCSYNRREVFGGVIFSCLFRNEAFFGQAGVDSSPFRENFPEVTFGGTYCVSEIGRSNLHTYDTENADGESISCCEHFHGSASLIMSYCPQPSQR